MVKFTVVGDDRVVSLGLGVSRENVNRLTQGKPIRVDLKQMGVTVDGTVLIYFAETEQELLDAVQESRSPAKANSCCLKPWPTAKSSPTGTL